jgi:hypothetical protein
MTAKMRTFVTFWIFGDKGRIRSFRMRKITTWLAGLSLVFAIFGPAWAGNLTSNGFFYKPSLGARGSGEKGSLDFGFDRVDTRLGKEIWVGDPNYGTGIQDAITHLGTANLTLHIPAGVYSIAANLTVPANIHLKLEKGAVFSIATGKTLTINGGLEAGLYQIFSCTGTGKVVFGDGSIDAALPEWWGAAPDGTTNCTAALRAAAVAHNHVHLGIGTYLVNKAIYIDHDDFTLTGSGYGTLLKLADGSTDTDHVPNKNVWAIVVVNTSTVTDGSVRLNRFHCRDLRLDHNAANQTNGSEQFGAGPFIVRMVDEVVLDNVHVLNACSTGFSLVNCSKMKLNNCSVYNVEWGGAGNGFNLGSTSPYPNGSEVIMTGCSVNTCADIGIWTGSTEHVIISNCQVLNASGSGIASETGHTEAISFYRDVSITGCLVDGAGNLGIGISNAAGGSPTADHLGARYIISNNQVRNVSKIGTGAGLAISFQGTDGLIANNLISESIGGIYLGGSAGDYLGRT